MNWLLGISLWLSFLGVYHSNKPLPVGIDTQGTEIKLPADQVDFLYDLTYQDSTGAIQSQQEIFDTVLSLIDDAQEYILMDMFLFNPWRGSVAAVHRDISTELMQHLLDRKKALPNLCIDIITDPINTAYAGSKAEILEQLQDGGINVIITDLVPLRDSNPAYSAFWRTFIQWFGNSENGGLLPHPFSADSPKVTMRSYLRMLNFKANHRKILLADSHGKPTAMVLSANPHDASSAHSNVGLLFRGPAAADLYRSELGVAQLSNRTLSPLPSWMNGYSDSSDTRSSVQIQLVTEKSIQRSGLDIIDGLLSGDRLDIAMFYLCEREIVNALADAAGRGVEIRIVLDPNRDAFGYEKSGIPNRQVANELLNRTDNRIQIRWYATHGEQFHSKMILATHADGRSSALLGSANLTRRNLENYNLETDVRLNGESELFVFTEMRNYYEEIWSNRNHRVYTVDYSEYADDSRLKGWIYRFQEFTGMCTF